MKNDKLVELTLPALRGIMGDWVYYSCLMDLYVISKRVRYADEIHKSKNLSDMIQRRLKTGRSVEIANYLKTQPERFFNSLVIATYGGQPNWYPLSYVRSNDETNELGNLPEETIESVGFLTLRGDEELFALDGQHRLAGIKKAISDGLEQDSYDEISVIFVAHNTSAKGLERTRRLFTTLNKTAKPVSKGDIIALDEDDVMAICVRRLIEDTALFSGNRIAFVATNNMPVANTTSLTTIGNLYDVLTILFTKSNFEYKKSKGELQRGRPLDDVLDIYFEYAKSFFIHARSNFPQLEEFFSSADTNAVVKKYRGSHGGDVLFRPIGLAIFTEIIAQLTTQDMPLARAVALAAKLPTTLNMPPYLGLMWDESNATIQNSHKVTLREILLYIVGRSKLTADKLTERYTREIGDDTAKLPDMAI
ncbi:MAG: DGQHR domain-containing protein [Candidatus Tectimicrobiota bacterium]